MTDQDAMLKLALAYDPSRDWQTNSNGIVHDGDTGMVFDPANNDSQAVAVLCWLLERDYKRNSDKSHYVTPNDVGEYNTDADDFFAICRQTHDRTPASFRAAVTKAALLVVS